MLAASRNALDYPLRQYFHWQSRLPGTSHGMRLGFRFTGADATGMHGAAASAAHLKPDYSSLVLTIGMAGPELPCAWCLK